MPDVGDHVLSPKIHNPEYRNVDEKEGKLLALTAHVQPEIALSYPTNRNQLCVMQ